MLTLYPDPAHAIPNATAAPYLTLPLKCSTNILVYEIHCSGSLKKIKK